MTELFKTALMITGFVLAMMLLIEYLNVLSAGEWQKRLAGHAWGQYNFGALPEMHFLTDVLQLEGAIRSGRWWMLLIACLVGLIPESGPHLIFVTLFAQGLVPMSIRWHPAADVLQTGHGSNPVPDQFGEAVR
jgi:hypothetical protein